MTNPPPDLTEPQLYVLRAISRGEVTRPAPGQHYDTGTWRINEARAVTATVTALIRRGLARESTEPVNDRVHAVPTADGYEELSKTRTRRA